MALLPGARVIRFLHAILAVLGLAANSGRLLAAGTQGTASATQQKQLTNTLTRPWKWSVVNSGRHNSNGVSIASTVAYFNYLRGDGRELTLMKQGHPIFPSRFYNAGSTRSHPFFGFGTFSVGIGSSSGFIESTADGRVWISDLYIGLLPSGSNQWETIRLEESKPVKLSRNGRYAFFLSDNLQLGDRSTLSRFDTVSRRSETLGQGQHFNGMGTQAIDCSEDGSMLLVRFAAGNPAGISHHQGYALWRSGTGFVSAPPEFHQINGISADGSTLFGESADHFPAISRWRDGNWETEVDRSQGSGLITHMSKDGSIRIRTLKPQPTRDYYLYWVDGPDGRAYRLHELLPPLVEYTNSRMIGSGLHVYALSDDGRTMVVGMLDGPDSVQDLSTIRYVIGVGDFVFPGEEGKMRVEKSSTGDVTMLFPTTTNQVYQVKSATEGGVPLSEWRNVGGASRGNGRMMVVAGSTSEATALYRLEVTAAP